MIMALITQAFRYAYEPFVFGNSREKDNKETYAKGMKYFVIFTLLAFLCVMAYMNVLRYIIKSDYWDGLKVVPIVMAAEMMMGIYFNLSFWYKLTDKTIWGAVFSGIGCAVLIGINVLLVPKYGYMACAWGGFAGYGVAMLLSYFVGQKYYPIDYPIKDMLIYTLLAAVLFVGITYSNKLEHRPGRRLPRLHREEGPAAGGDSGDREVFQEIDSFVGLRPPRNDKNRHSEPFKLSFRAKRRNLVII